MKLIEYGIFGILVLFCNTSFAGFKVDSTKCMQLSEVESLRESLKMTLVYKGHNGKQNFFILNDSKRNRMSIWVITESGEGACMLETLDGKFLK
jgi:hypothetical protein